MMDGHYSFDHVFREQEKIFFINTKKSSLFVFDLRESYFYVLPLDVLYVQNSNYFLRETINSKNHFSYVIFNGGESRSLVFRVKPQDISLYEGIIYFTFPDGKILKLPKSKERLIDEHLSRVFQARSISFDEYSMKKISLNSSFRKIDSDFSLKNKILLPNKLLTSFDDSCYYFSDYFSYINSYRVNEYIDRLCDNTSVGAGEGYLLNNLTYFDGRHAIFSQGRWESQGSVVFDTRNKSVLGTEIIFGFVYDLRGEIFSYVLRVEDPDPIASS